MPSRTFRKGYRPWRGWCHGNVARIHVCVCKGKRLKEVVLDNGKCLQRTCWYKWLSLGVGPSRFAFCALAFGILILLTVRTVRSEVLCYNFQVVHPRCVCQIIQYVFIVSTTLYINIICSTFIRTIY